MLEPFPPVGNIRWRIDPALSNIFITHLIICFIHLNLFHFNSDLIDLLLERPFAQNEDNAYLEIARSLHAVEQVGMAVGFIDKLWNKKPEFKENADAWFLFGYFQQVYFLFIFLEENTFMEHCCKIFYFHLISCLYIF